MYACILEIGGGCFVVVCAPSNATANLRDPPHPALCSGTKFAPLSAPITHGNLLHDLRGEESLPLNTSLNRRPRDGCAAIVSCQGKQGGHQGSGQPAYRYRHIPFH